MFVKYYNIISEVCGFLLSLLIICPCTPYPHEKFIEFQHSCIRSAKTRLGKSVIAFYRNVLSHFIDFLYIYGRVLAINTSCTGYAINIFQKCYWYSHFSCVCIIKEKKVQKFSSHLSSSIRGCLQDVYESLHSVMV